MRSTSVSRTLKSYSKIKYLMSLLTKCPKLARTALFKDLDKYSLLSPLHLSSFTKMTVKTLNHNQTSYYLLSDFTKQVKHPQVLYFYTFCNKKTENPFGIHLKSLGRHLGQSFNRLSTQMNTYFKTKDVVLVTKNVILKTPQYLTQRHIQRQQTDKERNITEGEEKTKALQSKDKQKSSGTNPSTQEKTSLQLFHISSLATRFGESYSYVANHINSVFSLGLKRVQIQENLEAMFSSRQTNRRRKRRKMHNTSIINLEEAEMSQVQLNAEEQLCAERSSTNKTYFSAQPTSQPQVVMSQLKQEEPTIPETGGLFHSSRDTTEFGESYFQMARHINLYFRGQRALDEGIDENNLRETDPECFPSERLKSATFMDCLRRPTSAIPDLLGSYLKVGPVTQTSKAKPAITSTEARLNKKHVLGQKQAEEMTRGLISSLGLASSPEALTTCIEMLNEHLIHHPSCKGLLWQEKTTVTLLRKRRTHRDDQALQSSLREALALIGYVDPVRGHGIRVLSIDGGGTRGVVPLQVLKLLEDETGKKIHQLFDYICGVSTGAVLAFMLGLARFSLEECADMYRRFGSQVFRQNPLVGTMKMGWSHSYYDTDTWEKILQEKLGNRLLIKTAGDELSPKVSAVSAVVNRGTSPKAYVFRNYNHKPGCLSRYAGSSGYQMWQAVRASSAAPGYFQEFPLQSDIHQDGGIILNNPCALAVHESHLLWPNQPFQCVLSLGTGRYDNVRRGAATSTSLRDKLSNLISSATDTEGVHTLLDDLLAPDIYFRFNPMLRSVVPLDESRPWALDQLQKDTMTYLERNRPKLARLSNVLEAERSAVNVIKDWMNERAWEMKQKWM